MKRVFFLVFFLLVSCHARAQITSTTAFRIRPLTAAPATCVKGDVYVDSSVTPAVPYYCSTTNTWTAFVSGGGAGVGGTGTTNTIAKFTAGSTIGDSAATDDASTVTVTNRALNLTGTTGSTPATGAGTRLMWIPAKNAFRAGIVSGTQWDTIGTGSHAIGDNNTVSVNQGIAIGTNNSVSGLTAQNAAFGFANTVSGTATDVAVGNSNTISGTAINTVAVGTNATCTGSNATCFAVGSGGTHAGSTSFAFMGGPILHYGTTSGALTLAVPATVTSYTITWPSAQGAASTVLTNDGSGGLTWAAGGGITGLTTNAVPKAASATTLTDSLLFSGVTANLVEQRSGTSAQTFYLYKTFTSSSSFRALEFETNATGLGYVISPRSPGQFVDSPLWIGGSDNTDTQKLWKFLGNGQIQPEGHSGDIGNSTRTIGNISMNSNKFISFGTSQGDSKIGLILDSELGNGSDANVFVIGGDSTINGNINRGIRPAHATGSNITGASLSIASGKGTGTGNPAQINFYAPAQGTASGSGAHTLVQRAILNGAKTGLTSGTAATIFQVALPAAGMTGGTVHYLVEATDGTDMQATSGTVTWSAVNKAAAYTTNIAIIGAESSSTSVGTLVDTWSITTGTNLINIRVTATSVGITPTTLRITYAVHNNGQTAVTLQ